MNHKILFAGQIFLVLVTHLFLDCLFALHNVNISVFPVAFAEFDGSGTNVFSIQLFDCTSKICGVFEADETIPRK